MRNIVKTLWKDERGFVVSAELVLIVTIGVLAMIVGISSIASSINNEMNDISNAFGALDQSYWYSGFLKVGHSGVAGSGFVDRQDFCDCSTIVRTIPRVKAPLLAPPRAFPAAPPRLIPPPHVVPPPICPEIGCAHDCNRCAGLVLRLADGTVIPLRAGATALLADGTLVPVCGLSAIRLEDGHFVPLAAGCAIHLAGGRPLALAGIAAFRLDDGTILRVSFGSAVHSPIGMAVPLAVANERWAAGKPIPLAGASAVRFVDGFPIAFAERTVVRILKPRVAPTHVPAPIRLTNDGIVWIQAEPAAVVHHVPFAGAVHAGTAGTAVSLNAAAVVHSRGRKPVAVRDGAAIRLANGWRSPLSECHFIRLARGEAVPLNVAVAVQLCDGCYVALANCVAIELKNGVLVPLSVAGELRLKGGAAVPLQGCVGPRKGCVELHPAIPLPKLHKQPPFGKMKKFGKRFISGKRGPAFKGKPPFRKPEPKTFDE
jgi:Flp pilus assembly pilin Flp